MPPTVVLHIGLMKSGTTFVQQQLFAHRGLLAEHGVLFPGASWGKQVSAVKDVLHHGTTLEEWTPIASAMKGHDGLSVLSCEFFAPARLRQRERVVATLRPAQIHVVITARDLNRVLMARWQETIQNGHTWHWADYVEDVRQSRPSLGEKRATEAGRAFWRHQNLPAVARAWGKLVDRVTVVTGPHPGADRRLLLDRFCEAAGLPQLPLAEGRINESLGGASILALRRMNELLEEQDLPFPAGSWLRKGYLAKRVLASRRRDEPSLGLPVLGWVDEEAVVQVRRIRNQQVPLVGDWADLSPVPVPGIDPSDVPDSEVAQAAAAGMAGLVQYCIQGQQKD